MIHLKIKDFLSLVFDLLGLTSSIYSYYVYLFVMSSILIYRGMICEVTGTIRVPHILFVNRISDKTEHRITINESQFS